MPAGLPETFLTRPLGHDDLDAVYSLISACERHDAGEQLVERSDIEADWSRPSADLGRDSIGVLDGDRLVGCAELSRGGARTEAYVHPGHRGHGIGSWLAGWAERRAAALGAPRTGQSVPEHSSPHHFLDARGYENTWTSWVLQLPAGTSIPDRGLPPGYRLTTAGGEASQRAAHEVVDTAFLEWSGRDAQGYDEWAAGVVRRPGFEPWMLRLVEHETDGVVGVCFTRVDEVGCGFVGQLAVDRRHRGRGLAQVLLADGFARARAHGATRSELTTDTRTGALDLYLKVGMEVTATWVHLATDPRRLSGT